MGHWELLYSLFTAICLHDEVLADGSGIPRNSLGLCLADAKWARKMRFDMHESTLETTKTNLERNGFSVYVCENSVRAREVFINNILPGLNAKSASYGDSITLEATEIIEYLRQNNRIQFIETFDTTKTWKEIIELRKQALSVDLFLAGANAVTEEGQIINLDMVGNRINGIVFGPKNVVLAIGKNKIVANLAEGMKRIKTISAPGNAKRHPELSTSCQKLGCCVNCSSEQRICNVWSIIDKCFPKKRIKILLINADLGL